MSVLNKIKSLFKKSEFYDTNNRDLVDVKIKFKKLDSNILNDIRNSIENNLPESNTLRDKKNKLNKANSRICDTVSDVLVLVEQIILADIADTLNESSENQLKYDYFLHENFLNPDIISIYNKLGSKDDNMGSIIYPVISIRKYKDKFYYWNNVD